VQDLEGRRIRRVKITLEPDDHHTDDDAGD
jgi:hypothetical protein